MLKKKQKQYLKGLANPLKPVIIIGAGGLSETVIRSIDEYLEAHELLKINVLKSCEQEIGEIVLDVLACTRAELISQLGRKIVIYRRSSAQPVIELPR
ncbi:MAG: ribosome assembly RNA-binding protein YhbY [Erysipelotrichaceae bacterium]|nr:ribosome assembly RNA-binding protein YhbY [Erysipelotrichaceae bacterium]